MTSYHPIRIDREITDIEEIKNILLAGKYTTIGMSNNNIPYVVTLNYGYDSLNHSLFLHAALKGQKLDYLRENNQVCATIILDGGYVKDKCQHIYSSLVIRGKMEVVTELEEKKHGLNIILKHLEENADAVIQSRMKSDESYDRVSILKLTISDISGKAVK